MKSYIGLFTFTVDFSYSTELMFRAPCSAFTLRRLYAVFQYGFVPVYGVGHGKSPVRGYSTN